MHRDDPLGPWPKDFLFSAWTLGGWWALVVVVMCEWSLASLVCAEAPRFLGGYFPIFHVPS